MNLKSSFAAQLVLSTALASFACSIAIPASAQEILIDDIDPAQGGLSEKGFSISADGSTAVGRNANGGDDAQNIRWTQDGGFEAFALSGVIQGLSGDGSVMAGFTRGANGRDSAFRWTQSGGAEILPYLSGDGTGFIDSAVAYDISDDGSRIVGFSNAGENFSFNPHAVVWTESGVMSLGTLENGANVGSFAYGISGDGSTIVGSSGETGKVGQTAFRYTDADGMVSLGRLNEGNGSEAFSASFDGSVIVGQAADGAAFNALRAVRWTESGGLQTLSAANVNYIAARANDVSADGSVIVGILGTGEVTGPRAFRWTEDTDAMTIENWLRAAGATILSDTTREAHGVSADGTVVVGETRDGQMFIARASGGIPDPDPDPNPDPDPDPKPDPDPDPDPTPDPDPGPNPEPGMITVDDLNESLGAGSGANASALTASGLLMNGAGSRPLSRRVLEGKSIVWLGGDLGRDDHDTRDGDIGLAEVGFGHNFGPFQINGIVGYSGLQQDTFLGGETKVDAGYVKIEALATVYDDGAYRASVLLGGTGLWGNADITRNYLDNGGLVDSSSGSTTVEGYGLRARLQWEQDFEQARIAPYGEISHARTCLDSYTEKGGAFPTSFNELCDDATEARLGFDATMPVTDTVRLIGTLEGVHRFQERGSNISGQVVGLGSFSIAQAKYQQEWLRGGAGLEVDLADSTLSVMGNATTHGETSSAWLAVNWRKQF